MDDKGKKSQADLKVSFDTGNGSVELLVPSLPLTTAGAQHTLQLVDSSRVTGQLCCKCQIKHWSFKGRGKSHYFLLHFQNYLSPNMLPTTVMSAQQRSQMKHKQETKEGSPLADAAARQSHRLTVWPLWSLYKWNAVSWAIDLLSMSSIMSLKDIHNQLPSGPDL